MLGEYKYEFFNPICGKLNYTLGNYAISGEIILTHTFVLTTRI